MKKQKNVLIVITQHAFDRAKERLSFTPTVLQKMALRAFCTGLKPADTKGFLHKYVDKLWVAEHKTNNIRIYGDIVYLFADNTLVTLFHVPSSLRKLIRVSKP